MDLITPTTIKEKKDAYLAALIERGVISTEEMDFSFNPVLNAFESKYMADWFIKQINFGWRVWNASKAAPEGFVLVPLDVAEKIELIIRDVAELPDRTSPEDWPEALIVTSGELEEILTQHLSEKCRNQEQSE